MISFRRVLLVFFWIAMMSRPVYSAQISQSPQHDALLRRGSEAAVSVSLSEELPEICAEGGYGDDFFELCGAVDGF